MHKDIRGDGKIVFMDTESSRHPFWSLTPKETAESLKTDVVHGLATQDVSDRLRIFGRNEFESVTGNTALKILLRQFESPLIFILIIAGSATLFIEVWFDAAIIFLAIGVNIFLGFFQENKAENAVARLRAYVQVRARVIRNGHGRQIDARDVVPGDIVHLSLGSRVPADARLLSVRNLGIDEAILTGESLSVAKDIDVLPAITPVVERRNMVFGGTLVTEGNGVAIVTKTGMATEFGKIAALVEGASQEQTPIEEAVAKLAWIITIGMSLFVVGIFVLGIAHGETFFDMFLVSIAVAVGAIPEALPIGLTAVLAVGVERLAKHKGIMQSLAAVETLGSTTIVITDKTGTLTEANMQLVDILSTEDLLNETKFSSLTAPLAQLSAEQKDLLSLAVAATDVLIENPNEDPASWRLSGTVLEMNIVRWAGLHDIEMPQHAAGHTVRLELPFSSVHKFSVAEGILQSRTVVLKTMNEKKDGHARVALGAPDILLARSLLTKDAYVVLLAAVTEASREGKRLLGVAVSVGHNATDNENKLMPEDVQDLDFVGVLAFFDPVRKEVPEAIKRIEAYGVRVVMATGDLKGTAVAVAHALGWTVADSEVCTGEDMQQLSDEEMMTILERVKVFARVTPQDKLRIAQLFQKRGEIVAMTGDGVNDAPALKVVDIGIAVGSGSDVAKGVADLVLLDNNFNTIVSAIEEGKRVLRNIRKTFVYLVSNSFDEVMLIGGSLLFGLALPLSAIQIIWVNFFTESLPAIAFAFDSDNDLGARTKHTEKHILNKTVKSLTLGVGILSSVLLFVLYWGLLQFDLDEQVVKTFVFACFGSYILFVAFSLRSLEKSIFSYNPFSNRFLNAAVLFGLFLLGATIYVPFLQRVFNTTALDSWWLLALGAWVCFNILLVEGTKWIFYRVR